MTTTTTQEAHMAATQTTTQVDPDLATDYLVLANQLHLEDSPEANQAIDRLAIALAGMEQAGLTDGTHLINMVAHMLGWQDMPY
jgi:hypothetical protein